MKIGMFRIFSVVALMCGCALALFPQGVPPQGDDASKGGTLYLRDVVVEKGKKVDTLVCVLCSVVVRGEVAGDVVTVWGNIDIEGTLKGDAVATGGKIVVRGEGAAEGDLVAVGGRVEGKGSKDVRADVSELPFIYFPGQRSLVFPGTLIFLGANVLFSILYLAAGRRRVEALAETVRRHAVITFVVGALGMSALVCCIAWVSDLEKYEDEIMLVVWPLMLLLVLPGAAGVSLATGRRLRRSAGAAMAMSVGALAHSFRQRFDTRASRGEVQH